MQSAGGMQSVQGKPLGLAAEGLAAEGLAAEGLAGRARGRSLLGSQPAAR
jgi:hypothetical protein